MAIKKIPKRTEETTIVRKSLQERLEEGRLARIQQKAVAEQNISVDEEDEEDDEGVDASIDDLHEYRDAVKDSEGMEGEREMENTNNVSNNGVRIAQVGVIEVNKGVDEAYQEHLPEAEIHKKEDDTSSKDSVDSSTGLEDMTSEFPTKIRFPKCQSAKVSSAIKGVLTIVSAKKFSYRMMFVEEIYSYIGSLKEVQIGIADKGIIVTDKISSDTELDGVFTLKKQGKSYIVYSAPLVKELTKEFSLDFSGTVSRTFSDATYGEYDGKKAVYIKLV